MNRRLLYKQIASIAICITITALLFGCTSKEKTADAEPKATLPDMSYITDDGIVVEGRIVKIQSDISDSIIYEAEGLQLIVDNSKQLKKVLPDPTNETFLELCELYEDTFFETHNLAISLFSAYSNEKVTYLSSIQFDNIVEQRYGHHDVMASGGVVSAHENYLFISEVTKDIDTIVLHEERYITDIIKLQDTNYITEDGFEVAGTIVQAKLPDSIWEEYKALGEFRRYDRNNQLVYLSGGLHMIIGSRQQLINVLSESTLDSFQELSERYGDSFFESHNLAISYLGGNSNEKITYLSSFQYGNLVEQKYKYHDVDASGGTVEASYVEYLFISEVTKDIENVYVREERYITDRN